MNRLFPVFCFLTVCAAGVSSTAETVPLTVADARTRAITFNRQFLSAKEDVKKAGAQITQARAGLFPDISAEGSYTRNFLVPTFYIFSDSGTLAFKTGSDNNFGAGISVSQPIWEGGKVLNAWAISKLYHKYTQAGLEQTEASVLYTAELLFFNTILQRANLEVLQKAFEANSHNLDVVEKFYAKGMASEFELLRARVEKANLMPGILAAESDVTLAEKRLKSFLGLNLSDSIVIIEEAGDTSLVELPPLDRLLDTALAHRPEVQRSHYLTQMTKRAIRVAQGDYQPTLDANAHYGWQAQSNDFQFDNQTRSLTAGLTLSIPLFQGGKTRGEVAYRRADYNQALLADQQMKDDVRLEVEQAYDLLMQAKKSLDVQKETIAQAEEGLRIANLRYSSGVGTQLDVLSAQASLTDARRAHALALNFFRQARAGLKKATTIDLDMK
ncbi:MAG: TolC family protein [Candidatus Zixiibacteriota bacterium]